MSTDVTVRRAGEGDIAAIAGIWHDGWADGHEGHVPADLARHRTLSRLTALATERVGDTQVAVVDGRVAGFVTVHDDEVEQVYVAPEARGSGVVTALLGAGEEAISAQHPEAWLAVVTGNARARRCYERHGWSDAGAMSYAADTDAGPFTVLVRRYVKTLKHPS